MKLDDIKSLGRSKSGTIKIVPKKGKEVNLGINVVRLLANIPSEGLDAMRLDGSGNPCPNAQRWISEYLLRYGLVTETMKGSKVYVRTSEANEAEYSFEPNEDIRLAQTLFSRRVRTSSGDKSYL